jgi:hypothetical protein
MKWEKPTLVDLADRKTAMGAVGISGGTPEISGWACQCGCTEDKYCMSGGTASILPLP